MALTKVKLVTIIAESILHDELVATLADMGASGYTTVESHGHGSAGRQAGELPGQGIRIETLVEESVAEKIASYVAEKYFVSYSVICFLVDAWVVRAEKYRDQQKDK
jgi:hypothetical protein